MENSINKTFQLGIKVLTPLHVGGGKEKEWANNLDFVQDNNKVYKLSQSKLMGAFQKDPNELAAIFAGNGTVSLKNKIKNLPLIAEQTFEFPFATSREIKSLIRTGVVSHPYIPGSSLKGALWSILFKHFGGDERNVKGIMGKIDDGSNFMRFIKVSDAHFEKTDLAQTKIFNLYDNPPHSGKNWKGGWKHGKGFTNDSLGGRFRGAFEEVNPKFAITYEIIPPQEIGQVNINFGALSFNKFWKHKESSQKRNHSFQKKQELITSDEQAFIFKIINEHTKSYIDKEIAFFQQYPNKETSQIIASYQWLKEQLPEDNNYCLLKMAAGSGFHSITGDWQYDNYDLPLWTEGGNRGKKKYKSRKIAIKKIKRELQFSPMGFVLLGSLDEINDLGLTIQEREIRQAEKERQAAIEKQRAAEKVKLAEERRLAAEKEQAQQAMEQKAKISFNAADTIEKLETFCKEFPNSELMSQAKEKILTLRQAVNQKAAADAREADLAFENYDLNAIKNYLKNFTKKYKKGFEFSDKQKSQIADALKKSWELEHQKPVNKNAFYKKKKLILFPKFPWTDIVNWIGKEKAEELFNQLNEK